MDRDLALRLAASPDLLSPDAQSLSTFPDALVLTYLAANDACPVNVLATLAGHPEPAVRQAAYAAALRPGSPVTSEWISSAASDPSPSVRMLAARHPACPHELLTRLAGDPDSSVSFTAGSRVPAAARKARIPLRPPSSMSKAW